MIGIIYHVVEKETNRVVKVGSTIQSLLKRWRGYDKKVYSNHFLLEAKRIESGVFDEYDSENSSCSFLWHLAAAEHLEAVRQGTFRSEKISNQFSPLVQKYVGFDSVEASKLAGNLGGMTAVKNQLGFLSPNYSREETSRKTGLANVASGHLKSISSKGGKASGAIVGKRNADSGWMRRVQQMGLGKGGKIGGPKGMHTRWHVSRNVVSPTCKLCREATG